MLSYDHNDDLTTTSIIVIKLQTVVGMRRDWRLPVVTITSSWCADLVLNPPTPSSTGSFPQSLFHWFTDCLVPGNKIDKRNAIGIFLCCTQCLCLSLKYKTNLCCAQIKSAQSLMEHRMFAAGRVKKLFSASFLWLAFILLYIYSALHFLCFAFILLCIYSVKQGVDSLHGTQFLDARFVL